MKGLHPGFGILDEPLQQNPDKKHRDLVINFLTSESSSEFARATTVQTVVITWLREDELQRLADADLRLLNASARISSIACCHRSRPPGRGGETPSGASEPRKSPAASVTEFRGIKRSGRF